MKLVILLKVVILVNLVILLNLVILVINADEFGDSGMLFSFSYSAAVATRLVCFVKSIFWEPV